MLGALLFTNVARSAVGEVTLEWDPNPEPEVSGYRLHIGPEPGTYNQTRDAGNKTTIAVRELVAGETYYFVVTAYDAAGSESLPSNEVSFTAPWPSGLHAKTVLEPDESGNRVPYCAPVHASGGNHFAIQINAADWTAVTLFVSSDLQTWNALGTVSNPTGRIVITDLAGMSAPVRFYRAGRAGSLPPVSGPE